MPNGLSQPLPPIEPAILAEAADWLTLLYSGEASSSDQAALQRWQIQSAMHRAAWQKAEAVMGAFEQAPKPIIRSTLSNVENRARRKALKSLAIILIATPVLLTAYQQTPWQRWQADLRTGTGERKSWQLADGTRLILNTASAVNVEFSALERRLTLLDGEILITTGKDPSPTHRPFIVHTAQGQMRALGTRFSVRQFVGETQLAVYEGAVEITAQQSTKQVIVATGEQRLFTANTIQAAAPSETSNTLWEQGMLLAKDIPLNELVRELGRYRSGVLRCDPSVAALRVSGAFPINDTDASLDLLQKTLPLQISRVSPWWVTVKAQ